MLERSSAELPAVRARSPTKERERRSSALQPTVSYHRPSCPPFEPAPPQKREKVIGLAPHRSTTPLSFFLKKERKVIGRVACRSTDPTKREGHRPCNPPFHTPLSFLSKRKVVRPECLPFHPPN